MKTLIIIGLQFPEPESTAAGVRMLQLIYLFKSYGYKIYFLCTQQQNELSTDLKYLQIFTQNISLNDSEVKNIFFEIKPDIVLFDRFITEEQFGWMIDEICPNALKILDTEDLHFLRENREKVLMQQDEKFDEFYLSNKAMREIGAIYRCDISLMISNAEIKVLKNEFNIPMSILHYLPFLVEADFNEPIEYSNRLHFVSIGNFKHKPNLDMVKHMYKNIWFKIKAALPDAEWHIYGAYLPKQISRLHSEKNGIIVKGRAVNALETLQNYRLMLAPLRFGAGLKGKCIDSMQAGTPSVTTHIGAEGIAKADKWPGAVTDDLNFFVKSALDLYSNRKLWEKKQKMGFEILKNQFQIELYKNDFEIRVENAVKNLSLLRKNNKVGELLKFHKHRSTKFMSLWIEEKNKGKI